MMWWLLALPALWLLTLWLLILLLFAGPVRAAWREPVLRHPVLIIESDDWGPGPVSHAQALRSLRDLLTAHRDMTGRPPVMTLGLILSLPDGEAIAASDFTAYRARLVTDPAYADILAALRAGIDAGVFVPQLHGMAHYWPPALMSAARDDPAVRDWLLAGPHQETEALPSPLQSRWVDGSVLPSRPIPAEKIHSAVAEEVALYRQVFGAAPEVVVPPTFVWTPEVEAAWAAHGVRALVTPGRPCIGRDAQGRPVCASTPIHNGQRGLGDIRYLVRDRYFEPARGHRAEQGLLALAGKTAQGRPCLLETHRFNFTGAGAEAALAELDALLRRVLAEHPTVRFISPAELAEHYRAPGVRPFAPLGRRLAAWKARMQEVPRFARLARLTGLEWALAGFTPRSRGKVT
jgi:hypothetical protein